MARHYTWVFQQGWYPLAAAHQKVAAARRAATVARQEAHALRISFSYRLGQALSWPLRMVLSQFAGIRGHVKLQPAFTQAIRSRLQPLATRWLISRLPNDLAGSLPSFPDRCLDGAKAVFEDSLLLGQGICPSVESGAAPGRRRGSDGDRGYRAVHLVDLDRGSRRAA